MHGFRDAALVYVVQPE